MTPILAAAALGAWSYGGFLAEPGPEPASQPLATAATAAVPAPRPRPAPIPAAPEIDDHPAPRPTPGPGPKGPEAAPPARSAAPGSQATAKAPAAARGPRYRLADASGQLWEHPDSADLLAFVQARNRSFFAPTLPQISTYGPSTCASGRCR